MTTTLNTESPATPSGTITAAPAQTLSILSLVLGISSIFFGLTFIVPIAAIVLGILALNREPAGRTMAIWGIVTGSFMMAGFVIAGIVGLAFIGPLAGFLFSGVFW